MSIWMFWKTMVDLCLYFSVIGALPTLFVHDFVPLWAVLACGIAATAASALSFYTRSSNRQWAMILPLLTLLLADTAVEICLLIPPIMYTCGVIVRGHFLLEYYHFREYFRKCLIGWAAFFAFVILLCSLENDSRFASSLFSYQETALYGIFFGVSGVLLQRQLRLGIDSGSKSRKANLIQTAAVLTLTGGVAAALVAAQQYLQKNMTQILDTVGRLMYQIITMPIGLLGWLLNGPFEEVASEFRDPTIPTSTTAATETVYGGAAPPMQAITGTNADTEPLGFPWWLLILILVLLSIALLSVMKLTQKRTEGTNPQIAFEKLTPRQEKSRQATLSNRAKIRRYYREYLKYEKRHGLKLKSNQTSQDILDHATRRTNQKAAAQLRRVYLKARYSDAASITAGDVVTAKAALKRIKETG